MTFAEYDSYDATGLAELVRKGQVTAAELVDAAIERIEQRNPRVNAVIGKSYERARDAAKGPLPDGPFRGVPFLLKDILTALAGDTLNAGSRIYRGWKAPRNSRLVDRFLRSGVVVIGRTNTPEFALMPVTEPEAFGPARNPWNTALTPGGSSGGSAAAVAMRMVPMASGGDGGGSIRTPSSCCGTFGFKPSRGRNPTGPFDAELWEAFAVEHVITQSVRDSAAMLDATAGPAVGEIHVAPPPERPFLDEVGRAPGKLRIAYSARSPLANELHPDCSAALDDAGRLLRELGHELVEVTLDLDGAEWKRSCSVMMAGICAADVRDAARRVGKDPERADFDRGTWITRAVGESFTAGEYAEAVRIQHRFALETAVFLSEYDAWLTPTLGKPPLAIGALYASGIQASVEELIARLQLGKLAWRSGAMGEVADRIFAFMPFTMLVNGAGVPSMSVPLHWNRDDVPIGVMLTGRYAEDGALFRLAGQLEKARPWANRKPPGV